MLAMSNATSSFSVNALSNILSDKVLGVADMPDWNARYQQVFAGMMEGAAANMQQRAAAKIPDTTPTCPLEEYCGTFSHPGFGSFTISQNDGSLVGKWNGFDAIFTHYHYDCYDMMLPFMGATLPVEFESDDAGHIATFQVSLEPTPGVVPVVFKKK